MKLVRANAKHKDGAKRRPAGGAGRDVGGGSSGLAAAKAAPLPKQSSGSLTSDSGAQRALAASSSALRRPQRKVRPPPGGYRAAGCLPGCERCLRNMGNQDRESAGVRRRQPRRRRGQLSLRRRGIGRRRRRGSACTAAPARHSTPRCAPAPAPCVWGEAAAETAGFLCCPVAVRLGFACLLTDRGVCRGKEIICALVTWRWQLGQVSCHVQVLLREF